MGFIGACINSEATYPDDSFRSRIQPMIIYIDDDFVFAEKLQIERAMKSWETATRNAIKFLPFWDSKKPGLFKDFRYEFKPNQGIFFWKLNKKDSKHLSKEIQSETEKYDGWFLTSEKYENSAHIVIFTDNISEEKFYQVALHELGHLMGLKHSNDANTVMFLNAQSSCITEVDARALCDIYSCLPKPECYLVR